MTSPPWQLSVRLIHLRSGWASGEESLTRVLERRAECGLGLRPWARLDKGLLPTGPPTGAPPTITFTGAGMGGGGDSIGEGKIPEPTQGEGTLKDTWADGGRGEGVVGAWSHPGRQWGGGDGGRQDCGGQRCLGVVRQGQGSWWPSGGALRSAGEPPDWPEVGVMPAPSFKPGELSVGLGKSV